MSPQCWQQGGGQGCSTGRGFPASPSSSWKSWTLAFDPGRGCRTCRSQGQESKQLRNTLESPSGTCQLHSPSPDMPFTRRGGADPVSPGPLQPGWHPPPHPITHPRPPQHGESSSSSCQATCSGKEKLHLQDLFILRLPTRRQLAPGD